MAIVHCLKLKLVSHHFGKKAVECVSKERNDKNYHNTIQYSSCSYTSATTTLIEKLFSRLVHHACRVCKDFTTAEVLEPLGYLCFIATSNQYVELEDKR